MTPCNNLLWMHLRLDLDLSGQRIINMRSHESVLRNVFLPSKTICFWTFFWASDSFGTSNFFGRPKKNWASKKMILGVHKILTSKHVFGRPKKCLWASKKNFWTSTKKILDVHMFFLDVQKNSWTSEKLFGRPNKLLDVPKILCTSKNHEHAFT